MDEETTEKEDNMKRVCTEEEREVLLKNKKQALTGLNASAKSDSWGFYSISTILSMFIAVGLMLIVNRHVDVPRWLMWIALIVLDILINGILWAVYYAINTKKQTKKFLNQKNLSVNGATIYEVYQDGSFAYIEDDVRDEKGNPVILLYPSGSYEVKAEEAAKRLLVMYDDAGNYQLLKLNDDLKSMIPSYSADYPLLCQPEECIRVMHPNMIHIEKKEKIFTDEEKKNYADLYVRIVRGGNTGLIKWVCILILILAVIICVLLNFMDDGVPFAKSVPISIIVYVGYFLFLLLISQLGKVNIRRQGQFVSKKDVVFQSYVIENKTAKVKVYEWVDGKPEVREYPAGNVYSKTQLGTILYKFKNKKGNPVLLNTEPKHNKTKK